MDHNFLPKPALTRLLEHLAQTATPKPVEGMPGTWSNCGTSRPHNPHRHTVVMNEGPTHNVLCKGFPGDPEGEAPLGRIVYEQ